jgi:hypothetical protein
MMVVPLVFLVAGQAVCSFISCAMDLYLRSTQLMTRVFWCGQQTDQPTEKDFVQWRGKEVNNHNYISFSAP